MDEGTDPMAWLSRRVDDADDPRLADYRDLRDVAAAQAPRGRARAVPRRGREGRTPRGRGRLPRPVVPDGAALARRAGRRARRQRRALLRRVRGARRAGHRLPRAPRRARVAGAPAAADAWTRCSAGRPDRAWCSRTSSTTPTSARSSARPPPWASTRCCSRRAAPTRSTGARSRSRWARCSRVPWTRLEDWYDALPQVSAAGFTTVALTLADDATDDRGGGRRARPGRAGARQRGARAVPALGAVGRPPGGDPDARRASTPSTSPPRPRWPATCHRRCSRLVELVAP